jgi:2-methylisocitrate lyase-like PEP mutase family enzyme
MNTSTNKAKALRQLMADDAVLAPSAFDATSARLIANAGFDCAHASGGSIARGLGFPDLGLVDLSEMAGRIASIVEAAGIPVVADADTGYGNALNVRRTVMAFERAGVAGLHLEDQDFPKRCGLYDDLAVINAQEMSGKIKAAVDARVNEDLVIIARTDALKVEGFDAAVERSSAYLEAGADMVFVEAIHTEAEIKKLAALISEPKIFNIGGGGEEPVMPLAELGTLGYRIILYPADVQRAAIRAMADVLATIRRDGHSAAMKNQLASGSERDGLVDVEAYFELSERYEA